MIQFHPEPLNRNGSPQSFRKVYWELIQLRSASSGTCVSVSTVMRINFIPHANDHETIPNLFIGQLNAWVHFEAKIF